LRGVWQKPKKNPADCVGGQLFLRLVEWNHLDNRSRLSAFLLTSPI